MTLSHIFYYKTIGIVASLAMSLTMASCELPPKKKTNSAYATPTESARDPLKSQELTQQAVTAVDEGNMDGAEKLLRDALSADLYHGPAHNNLGVLYLQKGLLYEAANEFEWARKLMPGHPDPRMNLALTLEHAGRIDEALATYETALEVYPNHIGTLQAICRCQLRHDRSDSNTQERMKEIAMRGEDTAWRDWAQRELIQIAK